MVVMRLATVYAIAATVLLERNLVWEDFMRKEVESWQKHDSNLTRVHQTSTSTKTT
jgi:hypothetical protein